ncbi:MAG: hypothetical protein PHZ00_07900, partial [Candidatus Peribacteraceae bacterium]|nr:hypothetical protein [Candidatus Peribacteraceae bacterium]
VKSVCFQRVKHVTDRNRFFLGVLLFRLRRSSNCYPLDFPKSLIFMVRIHGQEYPSPADEPHSQANDAEFHSAVTTKLAESTTGGLRPAQSVNPDEELARLQAIERNAREKKAALVELKQQA